MQRILLHFALRGKQRLKVETLIILHSESRPDAEGRIVMVSGTVIMPKG